MDEGTERRVKLAADIATIIEKASNIEGRTERIEEHVVKTNGHVAKAINDINIHYHLIKANEKKAMEACKVADEAVKINRGNVRWVVGLVIGNLALYGGIVYILIERLATA